MFILLVVVILVIVLVVVFGKFFINSKVEEVKNTLLKDVDTLHLSAIQALKIRKFAKIFSLTSAGVSVEGDIKRIGKETMKGVAGTWRTHTGEMRLTNHAHLSTFAHEWMHALDSRLYKSLPYSVFKGGYASALLQHDYAKEALKDMGIKELNIFLEINEIIAEDNDLTDICFCMDAISNEKNYYVSPQEKLAYVFQAYVNRKLGLRYVPSLEISGDLVDKVTPLFDEFMDSVELLLLVL